VLAGTLLTDANSTNELENYCRIRDDDMVNIREWWEELESADESSYQDEQPIIMENLLRSTAGLRRLFVTEGGRFGLGIGSPD